MLVCVCLKDRNLDRQLSSIAGVVAGRHGGTPRQLQQLRAREGRSFAGTGNAAPWLTIKGNQVVASTLVRLRSTSTLRWPHGVQEVLLRLLLLQVWPVERTKEYHTFLFHFCPKICNLWLYEWVARYHQQQRAAVRGTTVGRDPAGATPRGPLAAASHMFGGW